MSARWQSVRVEVLTGGEDAPMRLLLPGQQAMQGDAVLLSYHERLSEDSPEETEVRLRIRDGHVMMLRTGAFSTSLVFEPGRTHEGSYRTPYGELPLVMETHAVEARHEAGAGHCRLVYDLTIQGGEKTRHELLIRYSAAEDA